MGKEPEYLTVAKTPLGRVNKLLSKIDSIRVSKDRGSLVSKEGDDLFHKYVEQIESIFKNLPKPLKWRSFLMHDLILLTDIPSKVQKASVKHKLNKAQTKALARLERASDKVFNDVTQKGSIPFKGQNSDLLPKLKLNEFSGREIQAFAEDIEKINSKPSTRIAFLNADFRDFQGIPAIDEDPANGILVLEYAKLLENCGWKITHLIDCPLSTERFTGNMVSRMQKKRTLGIIRRTLIIGKANVVQSRGVLLSVMVPYQTKDA